MNGRLERVLAGLLLLAVSGCGNVQLRAQAELPTPLVDSLPVTIGVHYPEEFRNYVHKETRYQLDYEIELGGAHVAKLNRLLGAMFDRVVEVDDPTRALEVDPSIVLVLEPRFEDYAFLTPRDMVGEAYTVTIRYRVNLYDPRGERVDAYVFTGFGRRKSGTFSGTEPLLGATQRAMRDAGAKLAVELTEQESVRELIAGHEVVPKPTGEQDRNAALGSFGQPVQPAGRSGERSSGAAETGGAAADSTDGVEPGTEAGDEPGDGETGTPASLTPESTTPADAPPAGTSGAEAPPAEAATGRVSSGDGVTALPAIAPA